VNCLAADPNARENHTIVGAENPAGLPGVEWTKKLASYSEADGRRAEARCKLPPRNTFLIILVAGHGVLLELQRSRSAGNVRPQACGHCAICS